MEYWDLYDTNRVKTGEIHMRGKTLPEYRYHIVVHVWIMNSQNQVLLTKRNPLKPYGNLWECTGGSALAGETSLQAVLRETREEIGLSLLKEDASLLKTLKGSNDFVDVYLFRGDFPLSYLSFTDHEVIDAMWVDEIKYYEMCTQGVIVPAVTYFFDLFEQHKLFFT